MSILEFLNFLDVDECGNGNHDCDMNANCMNTDGSFVCVCNSGWSGDGVVCNSKYFILCVIEFLLVFNIYIIFRR